jgi:hypothetical protein
MLCANLARGFRNRSVAPNTRARARIESASLSMLKPLASVTKRRERSAFGNDCDPQTGAPRQAVDDHDGELAVVFRDRGGAGARRSPVIYMSPVIGDERLTQRRASRTPCPSIQRCAISESPRFGLNPSHYALNPP